MSAHTTTHPTEILDDLDLSLYRLRGACVILGLVADEIGLNDASDPTAAFFATLGAMRKEIEEAQGLSDQMHKVVFQIGGVS